MTSCLTPKSDREMHELSLAMSVAEIVASELDKRPGASLREVTVRVGRLAGVELDTFEAALATVLEADYPGRGVKGVIESVEAQAECLDCGARFVPPGRFPACPECGSAACMLTGGTEFRVASITLDRPEGSGENGEGDHPRQ